MPYDNHFDDKCSTTGPVHGATPGPRLVYQLSDPATRAQAEEVAIERRDLRQWALEHAVAIYAGEGLGVTPERICALADTLLAYITAADVLP